MEKLRINFVMPPSVNITGGPLAIMEYATRFIERGHEVSITTYPDTSWSGENPFPWFDFKGPIYFKRLRNQVTNDPWAPAHARLLRQSMLSRVPIPTPFEFLSQEILTWLHLIDVMPECDINVATFWSTAFPVFYSFNGKPVYFMQHYEEVFYPLEPALFLHRLAARMSYGLPMYKVANSSWLRDQIKQKFGQDVPFSNNGIVISDFSPKAKRSSEDGIIRIVTYSHTLEWKGFADAAAAIAQVRQRFGSRVEWHVFGYRHPTLSEDNVFAPYTYHPKLSFADLANLYATSDLALCPSWYESFPLPPLEAMASGTAVVTTKDGTEDYAFDDANALVVKSRDINGMAEAISRLIQDDELRTRLSVAGRETAEKLDWKVAVEKREQILLGIHHGDTDYDIFKSAKTGFTDGCNEEYERAPVDLGQFEPGLIWDCGNLFLLHDATRRHVAKAHLIPGLLQAGFGYVDVDPLSLARTPMGSPLLSEADLPKVRAQSA